MGLRSTIAQGIASAASVADTSVVDLSGSASTVTIQGSTVSAFLLHLTSSSVSSFELADIFYGSAFRGSLESILRHASSNVDVVSVALDRESCTPEVPTTTATTTTLTPTSTATATATTTETSTRTSTIPGSDGANEFHHDMTTSIASGDSTTSFLGNSDASGLRLGSWLVLFIFAWAA